MSSSLPSYEPADPAPGPVLLRSPFLGLQIFITAFAIWLIFQLLVMSQQRTAVQATLVRLLPAARGAEQQQQQLQALINDLQATAGTDASAAQILKEFNLPASRGAPAPVPAP